MRTRRLIVRAASIAAASVLVAVSPAGLVDSASRGATIVVNSTADVIRADGSCTLREAIRSANLDQAIGGCSAGHGTDTIVLPAGHFVLKIYGTAENGGLSGDLDIWTAMTIQGSRGLPTIIDGGGIDRVFDVVGEAHVTIDHLTIEGGSTTDAAGTDDHGAGITTSGALTLTNSVVDGNRTSPEGTGGGIYNTGTLNVTDSIVSNNYGGSGGGIYSTKAATLRYDLIEGNTADGRYAVKGPDIAGGISSHGWLDVYQSVVTNNSGGQEWGNGGIAMDGGVVSLTAIESNGSGECGTGGIVMSNTVLSRSTVAYNSAGYCGVAGVYAINSQVVNTTISNNVIPYAWGGESVGGIRSEGSSLLNVTIANNATADGPGGLDPEFVPGSLNPTVLTNSIIADNSGQHSYPSTAAWPDCGGIVVDGHASVVSGGNNLIRDLTTCVLVQRPSDLVGVNPLLEPLANYGGPKAGPRSEIGTPLLTHAMRPNSPAIDAIGVRATCPALDERGVHRPQDGNGDRVRKCDIGAVEWMR